MKVGDTGRISVCQKRRWLIAALLVVTAALAFAGTAGAMTGGSSSSTNTPWIISDQADYAPGSTVHLTGGDWQPGESVQIVTNDMLGNTWSQTDNVTADADGNIADDVVLPTTFIASYTVTATGAQSGTATTAFTDGNLTLHLSTSEGPTTMSVPFQSFGKNSNPVLDCSGTGTTPGASPKVVAAGGTGSIGIQSFESVRLGTVTTSTPGYTFDRWTSGTPTTDSGVTVSGSPTPCIAGSSGGANGNVTDLYAHFQISNHPPVASAQSVSTNEDTPKSITLSGTDQDGNSLTFAIVSGPSHGSLGSIGSVSCSGTPSTCSANVQYTPNANYNGSDSFTFKVNDGTVDSSAATVSITVNPVNDQPVATDASATLNEDASTSIDLSALVSDLETSNANLTYTIASGPSHGSLTGSGSSRTYTPDANFNGSDSFTYNVTDRGDPDNCGAPSTGCDAPKTSATKTVSITVNPVNDQPVATDGSASLNEDGSTSVDLGALVSDTETSDANLTYTIVAGPAHGALSGSGTSRTYTPASNFNGSDSFTYNVTDRGDPDNCGVPSTSCDAAKTSATKTVSITVDPVNDKPVASDGSASLAEDGSTSVDLSALVSDIETSNANLTYSIVSGPGHGALTGSGGSRTYTPDANYNGADSFTYKVTDSGDPAGCSGSLPACDAPLSSDTKTVSITINPVNDKPAASNGTASLAEDGSTSIDLGALVSDQETPDANLTYTILSGPGHGSLGTPGPSTSYTPDTNYNGPDSFTYKVTDRGDPDNCSGSPPSCDTPLSSDTKTISITVTEVNDPPVAALDSVMTPEDTSKAIDAIANDSPGPANESGQTLHVDSIVSAPSHGTASVITSGPDAGKILYTPAANYNGSDSFTYKVCDNGTTNGAPDPKCDTGTVNVTVTPVNDAPVVTAGVNQSGNENDTITAGSTFTDVEAGDAHTCSIDWGDGSAASIGTVVEPSGATPGSCTGTHKYLDDNPTGTPSDDYTATFTVTDNGTTNGSPDPQGGSATLKVTIANLAPVITSVTGPSAPLGLGGSGVNATVVTNFTDAGSQDTHTCTYTWDDSSPSTPVSAPGPGSGSCSATHTYTAAGVYQVGVMVKDDDTGTATGMFQYVVVYDANAGFVTGGGWIMSPTGAYTADQNLTGRANFGFTSQYKKGATVPTGETEFQFQVASFNFHSENYQWLVVSGAKAQYKGTGTVNGSGNYGFLLTATDGAVNGGGGVDKFRIKIWRMSDGTIVYDNSPGSSEDIDSANPEMISGGSIVIHK